MDKKKIKNNSQKLIIAAIFLLIKNIPELIQFA